MKFFDKIFFTIILKKMKKSQEEQRSTAIGNLSKFMKKTGDRQDKNQKGSFEFSLGDLFKCVCCIHSGISHEEKRLNEINESLQQINKHLSLFDRFEGVMFLEIQSFRIIIYNYIEIWIVLKVIIYKLQTTACNNHGDKQCGSAIIFQRQYLHETILSNGRDSGRGGTRGYRARTYDR